MGHQGGISDSDGKWGNKISPGTSTLNKPKNTSSARAFVFFFYYFLFFFILYVTTSLPFAPAQCRKKKTQCIKKAERGATRGGIIVLQKKSPPLIPPCLIPLSQRGGGKVSGIIIYDTCI